MKDVLPSEAARRDAIAKVKSFWGFQPELQTKPMPFQLDSPWGATLMPLRACAMDWGPNRIPRVGKHITYRLLTTAQVYRSLEVW